MPLSMSMKPGDHRGMKHAAVMEGRGREGGRKVINHHVGVMLFEQGKKTVYECANLMIGSRTELHFLAARRAWNWPEASAKNRVFIYSRSSANSF